MTVMSTTTHTLTAPAKARQLNFDWLVPDKPMLRVGDVMAATGMQQTFVEDFFAAKCHRYGAGDERVRPPMRIPRAFAICARTRGNRSVWMAVETVSRRRPICLASAETD